MRNPHGTPIWYEYQARDAEHARAFYTQMLGWQFTPTNTSGVDYRVITAPGGGGVGGMMAQAAGTPMPPGWLFYIGVDDVDATVAAATAAGAVVHLPAMDLPGAGRLALLADPHGTPFYVMRGEIDAPSGAFDASPAPPPGHAVWNELTAPDQDAALGFYATLFGWRHEGAMPMGALGDYKFVHAGNTCIGASMNGTGLNGAGNGWQFYFAVDDVDAAVARLGDGGGVVVQGPDRIPGGSYAVVAADPAGVRFGMVGPRRA